LLVYDYLCEKRLIYTIIDVFTLLVSDYLCEKRLIYTKIHVFTLLVYDYLCEKRLIYTKIDVFTLLVYDYVCEKRLIYTKIDVFTWLVSDLCEKRLKKGRIQRPIRCSETTIAVFTLLPVDEYIYYNIHLHVANSRLTCTTIDVFTLLTFE